MNKEIIDHFQRTWEDYDGWYDTHKALYQSELAALKKLAPSGKGLEIGVGTGRFAAPLGVQFGLDPALNMLKLAKKRRILVVQGSGESLPFKGDSFDFIQIIFVIEFVDNPLLFLGQAVRALKPNGVLILGFIDRNSRWGVYYSQAPSHRKYFDPPSPKEVIGILESLGLEFQKACQTLFQPPPDILELEDPRSGFGEGGFVVFRAKKSP